MSSSSFKKLFSAVFPPPRFLEMPSVGFDISDEVIRFAELKRSGSHYDIGIFGAEPLPKDIIEEGYIKDKEGFAKVLGSLRKKHNLTFIKASLPDEKAYLFKTQIPVMDEMDIRGAIQYKIEENVPLSLKDAVFDYRIISRSQKADDGSLHMDVGVTVMHAKVVTNYINAFHAAGLIPLELRTEAQAIAHTIIAGRDICRAPARRRHSQTEN